MADYKINTNMDTKLTLLTTPQKYYFTHADRSMIRRDWLSLLPDMKARPKTNYIKFTRMVGPLVICISLSLENIILTCKVRYYIHNLADKIHFGASGLRLELCSKYGYFKVFEHHKEYYPKSI